MSTGALRRCWRSGGAVVDLEALSCLSCCEKVGSRFSAENSQTHVIVRYPIFLVNHTHFPVTGFC